MTTLACPDCCPACHGDGQHILNWQFSGLGKSVFNTTAAFYACSGCGLVYIGNLDDATLAGFYTEECAYFSSDHFDINSKENIEKYRTYHSTLDAAGLVGHDILDVGCGRGGFLRWLKKNQWQGRCCGVDADQRSIPESNETTDGVAFKQGDAFHLPVADHSQELLTYFHVLEHLRNLDLALAEISRALKDGGHLLIEVPDAERYADHPIGTAFWFGIREHVNHFSPAALESLLKRHGLATLRIVRGILPTPEFTYPSLLLLAQKTSYASQVSPPASNITADFLRASMTALRHQAEQVTTIMGNYEQAAFWGCSAQLFSLLPLLNLDNVQLCDASKLKQQSYYQAHSILAPNAIDPTGKALFVAPYLHRQAIRKAALSMGWQESNIYSLE